MTQEVQRLESFKATTDQEPYDFYDRLREAGDAVWDEDLQALLVGSYDLVRATLRRDDRALRKPRAQDIENDPVMRALVYSTRSIAATTGREHAKFHTWWLKAYSRANVERWRPTHIRPVVNAIIDRFADRGHADLVGEFTQVVPMRVIASVIGLPWQDEEWIESCRAYLNARSAYLEAGFAQNDTTELGERTMAIANDFVEKLRPFAERGPIPGSDDLISVMWNDGPGVFADWSSDDVLATMITSFFAGSHTTASASATGLYMLLQSPDLQDSLRAGGNEAVEAFVDEALRIGGVGHFILRYAKEDLEIGGVEVKNGDAVMTVLASASRDPRHYGCPADIDLDRPNPRDHMTFAMGPRSCGGMWLARGDLAEMYSAILERLDDVRLDPDAEPPRLMGFSNRTYKPLHVRFTPERAGSSSRATG